MGPLAQTGRVKFTWVVSWKVGSMELVVFWVFMYMVFWVGVRLVAYMDTLCPAYADVGEMDVIVGVVEGGVDTADIYTLA